MLSIRAIRKSKGMTQKQLAEASGIALPNLCRLETGKDENPTLSTLRKLAEALDVTIEDLAREVALPTPETTGEQKEHQVNG